MNTEIMLKNLSETVGEMAKVERMRMLIDSHPWQFAKSMPGVPHEYSLKWKWSKEEFNEAINFIWDHGVDAWFSMKYPHPKRYWFDHESGWYYFVDPLDFNEDRSASEICKLINRARIEKYRFWEEDSVDGRIVRCKVKYD